VVVANTSEGSNPSHRISNYIRAASPSCSGLVHDNATDVELMLEGIAIKPVGGSGRVPHIVDKWMWTLHWPSPMLLDANTAKVYVVDWANPKAVKDVLSLLPKGSHPHPL